MLPWHEKYDSLQQTGRPFTNTVQIVDTLPENVRNIIKIRIRTGL